MGELLEARDNSLVGEMMGTSTNAMSNTDVWTEMLDNENLLHSQYDVIAGHWPEAYNEVVLIVNDNDRNNNIYISTRKNKRNWYIKSNWSI